MSLRETPRANFEIRTAWIWAGVFSFSAQALLVRRRETQAVNENKSKWNFGIMLYSNILKGHLRIWLSYFVKEDLCQPVRPDWAFASQHLKLTGQMSDDQRLFAGL